MIEPGGLVIKASIVDLTNDDRATIYGAMIWMAEKLNSEDGEHARGVWTKLGKMAFEVERPADPNDRVRRSRIERDRWRVARRPHISQRRANTDDDCLKEPFCSK